MNKVFGLLLLGLLLFGCVGEAPTEDWTPEGVSIAPSIEAEPTPSPAPSPSPSIEASPSPIPSAEPTEEPEPTPSSSPEPEASCSITLQSLGDAEKRIIVTFENYGGVAGEVQCTPAGSWHEIGLNTQQMGYYDCIFEQEATETSYTVTARGGTATCSVTVHVPASTVTSSFTVSPSSDAFNVDKTVSNTTIRYYLITNTGDAQLTGIICNSSVAWVNSINCPSSLAVNGTSNASYSFNSATLNVGLNQAVLTFEASGAEDFPVGVEVTVTETAVTPTCTMGTANPSTVNATNVTYSTTTVSMTYSDFTGTLTPLFDCGSAVVSGEQCNAGTCTADCEYISTPLGDYQITASLSGVACEGNAPISVVGGG